MKCNEEKVGQYFHNELSSGEEDETVFEHIISCQKCSDYLATLSVIDDHKNVLHRAYQEENVPQEERMRLEDDTSAASGIFINQNGELDSTHRDAREIYLKVVMALALLAAAIKHRKRIIIPIMTVLVMVALLSTPILFVSNDENSDYLKYANLIEAAQLSQRLESITRNTRQERPAELEKAITALNNGNYDETLSNLQQTPIDGLSNRQKQLISLTSGMAHFYQWQAGEEGVDASIADLNKAKMGPYEPYREYALLTLAQIYLLQEDVVQAKQALEAAKKIEQDHFTLIKEISEDLKLFQ